MAHRWIRRLEARHGFFCQFETCGGCESVQVRWAKRVFKDRPAGARERTRGRRLSRRGRKRTDLLARLAICLIFLRVRAR